MVLVVCLRVYMQRGVCNLGLGQGILVFMLIKIEERVGIMW